jgi:hypothetical protein
MPTPVSANTAATARKRVAEFSWGAWAELGVSGWGRTHQDWAIDPEPLIVFTAGIIPDLDARLRDEVLDWCIHYWRHVSQTRLKNVLNRQLSKSRHWTEDLFEENWGRFAATVNQAAGIGWPGATSARSYKTTGRSLLRPLTEPSKVILRLRSIFGLTARTEVLRHLLFNADRVTAADLAERTHYVKRNVAEACESLTQAGILESRAVRNRFYYSLAEPDALRAFVGDIPSITPDWSALLNVTETILELAELKKNVTSSVLTVETHQAAERLDDDLGVLGISPPERLRGSAFSEVWDRWASAFLAALAAGKWPSPTRGRSCGYVLREPLGVRRKLNKSDPTGW